MQSLRVDCIQGHWTANPLKWWQLRWGKGRAEREREWNKKIKLMTKNQLKDLWKSQLYTIFHFDLLIYQQINDFYFKVIEMNWFYFYWTFSFSLSPLFSHHNENHLNHKLKQKRGNCMRPAVWQISYRKESNII